MCQQAGKRREKDKERQIRDKELLERWPRVDGDAELRLLYEGAIPKADLSIILPLLLELKADLADMVN